mmetsp:Transcript_3887/g.10269  ORF Transcript_3887/g.10269 Transcript_3887/m.10269 type:complete len:283 (-) Transcript_3887:8-856(-)
MYPCTHTPSYPPIQYAPTIHNTQIHYTATERLRPRPNDASPKGQKEEGPTILNDPPPHENEPTVPPRPDVGRPVRRGRHVPILVYHPQRLLRATAQIEHPRRHGPRRLHGRLLRRHQRHQRRPAILRPAAGAQVPRTQERVPRSAAVADAVSHLHDPIAACRAVGHGGRVLQPEDVGLLVPQRRERDGVPAAGFRVAVFGQGGDRCVREPVWQVGHVVAAVIRDGAIWSRAAGVVPVQSRGGRDVDGEQLVVGQQGDEQPGSGSASAGTHRTEGKVKMRLFE